MEKKESADAQKHNLDFVCIKYDFIPHPIHKTNQIYQTIKQSNFDSVFAHYLICCHIPHTHISLLLKNDAWRIGSMLDEMYNQGKPKHRKKVYYQCFDYYKIELRYQCIVFQEISSNTVVICFKSRCLFATFTRMHFGFYCSRVNQVMRRQ